VGRGGQGGDRGGLIKGALISLFLNCMISFFLIIYVCVKSQNDPVSFEELHNTTNLASWALCNESADLHYQKLLSQRKISI